MTGVQFKCSTAAAPPYQFLTPLQGEKEGQVEFDGYSADVWKELQRITNFSYVMYLSADGGYGTLKEDGTWTGQIGINIYQRQ